METLQLVHVSLGRGLLFGGEGGLLGLVWVVWTSSRV